VTESECVAVFHCTLHTAHCTLHSALCTLHSAHCTVFDRERVLSLGGKQAKVLHTAHCTPRCRTSRDGASPAAWSLGPLFGGPRRSPSEFEAPRVGTDAVDDARVRRPASWPRNQVDNRHALPFYEI